MRDIVLEIVDELDGIAEDINPTPEPEPEPEVSDTRSVKKKGGSKK